MKKALLALTALLSLNATAVELQIKGGYDIVRRGAKEDEFFGTSEKDLTKGFVANVEFIPVNKYRVEGGVGLEYNFGTHTPLVSEKNGEVKKADTSTYGAANGFYHIPLYGLVKANVVQLENGDSPLSVVGKLGYAFVGKNGDKLLKNGGLYYALGINSEYKYFVAEVLASRTHVNVDNGAITGLSDVKVINKLGLTAGVRVGNVVKPATVVEEVVVAEKPVVEVKPEPKPEPVVEVKPEPKPEPVVEVKPEPKPEPVVEVKPEPKPEPVVVEKPKPVEITINGKLPTHCSFETKECVIHGFAIDGREPSQEEAAAIREIVAVVNEFAAGGAVTVVGHTDSTGSVAYNQRLSESRANVVAKLLKENGLRNDLVINNVIGKSELSPMATNKTKQGRYLNRRVVLNFENVNFESKYVTPSK